MICVYGAIGIGFWWSMLPVSQYHLKNTFFADGAVLFWSYFMVLFEMYIELHQEIYKLSWKRYLFFAIRFIIILLGMWTDYYFWVFMFVACLSRFFLDKSRMGIQKNMAGLIKNYIVPVVFSMVMFAAQVNGIPNGWNTLIQKFRHRTSSVYNGQNMYIGILENIKETFFVVGGVILGISFIIAIIYVLYWAILAVKKKQKVVNPFLFLTVSLTMLPSLVQILILKNHLGIHEFAMIKLGIPCVLGMVLVILILNQVSKNIKNGYVSSCFVFSFNNYCNC